MIETATDAYAFDPMAPLQPTGNLRRRQLVSRLLVVLAMASAAVAVAALGLVTFEVARHGASVLSVAFVTHNAAGVRRRGDRRRAHRDGADRRCSRR